MNKQQIIADYQERIGICIFDGGLSEEEAKAVALRQIIEDFGGEAVSIIKGKIV